MDTDSRHVLSAEGMNPPKYNRTRGGGLVERSDKTIVVTGATGHQGGAVARHLLQEGWRVRALTRDPEKPAAQDLEAGGADVVRGDMLDRASLDAALVGAYGCFSVQTPREAGPEGEKQEGRNLADAAKAAGVEHFVYSSVIGAADGDSSRPWVASKHFLETYIRDLGLPWTIWRPCSFMENFLGQAADIVRGVVRGPEPPGAVRQFIAVDDIGRFVALSFADRECWMNETTLIAGDRMHAGEIAEAFADVLERDVVYQQAVPPGQAPGQLTAAPELANLSMLRDLMPGLRTLESWACEIDWTKAAERQTATTSTPR